MLIAYQACLEYITFLSLGTKIAQAPLIVFANIN